ncbi:hypothetical protein JOB18_029428 [Solea senegalensis]|nr:hypothetical protein JOB18_029428 [Solea senegalensis]
MHFSILTKGATFHRTTITPSLFGCPLCPRFRTTKDKASKRHVNRHIEMGVQVQDTLICRCNMPCRDRGHYHCLYCAITILRKEDLYSHLSRCQNSPPPPANLSSALLSSLSLPPSHFLLSEPLKDSVAPVVSVEHSNTLPPSVTSVSVQPFYAHSSTPSPQLLTLSEKSFQLPTGKPSEPPPKEAVDLGYSLNYGINTATEEILKHEVLEELLECKFFTKSTVAVCKKRQKEAEEAHAALCVLVEHDGSQDQICLSVHEPTISHFCSLGRVVVTYDNKKHTWHCPCVKVNTSCPHKDIAKWHLLQTQKKLFTWL